MARISINNGNTVKDVADLTDQEIANALEAGALDQEISDMAAGVNDREWLDCYCRLHEQRYGSHLVIG